jgi:O-antigen/teichoic acid export membrane protein
VDPEPVNETTSPQQGSYRSGFAFGILSFLAVAGFGLVSTIVTARIYGVTIIGEFALTMAPVTALWVLSTAKEQAALIKEITGLPRRHARVTQLFGAVFTFSSALTIVMSVLAAVVVWRLFKGPLRVPQLIAPAVVSLAGYALVTNTAWNFDAIFSAFVAGRQLFWVRLHEVASFLVIAVALGHEWRSIWGLVVATIGGSLTSLVHRVVIARRFVRLRMSFDEYRSGLEALPGLLRFGLKITPGSIAQGLGQQAGVWTIRAFGGSIALVGAYSRAQTIPERLQQVNLRIVEVLYPTLVGRRGREDHEGFDRALTDTVRYTLVGLLLIAALIGGAAEPILRLFGPGFSRASVVLTLLMLYPALNSVAITQNQALLAVDLPGLTSVVALTRMVLTVAATIVFTPPMGITGPAVALLAGAVVDITWKTVVLRSHLSGDLRTIWPLRQRLALVGSYAGGLAAAYFTTNAFPSTAGLVIGLPVATLAYVALLVALGAVHHRDRERLSYLREMLRTKRDRRRGGSAGAVSPSQSP